MWLIKMLLVLFSLTKLLSFSVSMPLVTYDVTWLLFQTQYYNGHNVFLVMKLNSQQGHLAVAAIQSHCC